MEGLRALEHQHDVKVLFACESGSRGWGFASPGSDYDVRFIYVNRPALYLSVDPRRDVRTGVCSARLLLVVSINSLLATHFFAAAC